ncbi:hypothetical protein NVP1055O_34 [Vibrio phage 1.055.O._10N.286.55.E9]|nr:hypothetical protein NVP1055O_34 [Vibrio phage 1.055.O._10N.286.55.E9]
MSTTPVLMSVDNPDGWKLGDLSEQLIVEMIAKTKRIENDTSDAAKYVYKNNMAIIQKLHWIKALNDDSYKELEKVAPDSGATGTPRIGDSSC